MLPTSGSDVCCAIMHSQHANTANFNICTLTVSVYLTVSSKRYVVRAVVETIITALLSVSMCVMAHPMQIHEQADNDVQPNDVEL